MAKYYANELYHFGILGQKWGVRRFQNKDGSYTEEGKRRRSSNDNEALKKKLTNIGKGVGALAVGAGAAYALYKNPLLASKISGYIAEGAKKASPLIKTYGKKTLTSLGKSASIAGQAAFNAALATIGTIAIADLAERYKEDQTLSKAENNKRKIIVESGSAAIKSATNANNYGGSSTANKSVGKEVTARIGAPSNKGIDRSSTEYQKLFKKDNGEQRDADTRSTIKSLANAGYDIDQIKKYLSEFGHSGLYIIDGKYLIHRII